MHEEVDKRFQELELRSPDPLDQERIPRIKASRRIIQSSDSDSDSEYCESLNDSENHMKPNTNQYFTSNTTTTKPCNSSSFTSTSITLLPATSNQILKDMQKELERQILNTLNFGTKKQIMQSVKGVGVKRADLIITNRDMNGAFLEFLDLKRVGLSDVQLSAILKLNLTIDFD